MLEHSRSLASMNLGGEGNDAFDPNAGSFVGVSMRGLRADDDSALYTGGQTADENEVVDQGTMEVGPGEEGYHDASYSEASWDGTSNPDPYSGVTVASDTTDAQGVASQPNPESEVSMNRYASVPHEEQPGAEGEVVDKGVELESSEAQDPTQFSEDAPPADAADVEYTEEVVETDADAPPADAAPVEYEGGDAPPSDAAPVEYADGEAPPPEDAASVEVTPEAGAAHAPATPAPVPARGGDAAAYDGADEVVEVVTTTEGSEAVTTVDAESLEEAGPAVGDANLSQAQQKAKDAAAPAKSGLKLGVPAIIGIAVGGFALVAVATTAFVLIRSRKSVKPAAVKAVQRSVGGADVEARGSRGGAWRASKGGAK